MPIKYEYFFTQNAFKFGNVLNPLRTEIERSTFMFILGKYKSNYNLRTINYWPNDKNRFSIKFQNFLWKANPKMEMETLIYIILY